MKKILTSQICNDNNITKVLKDFFSLSSQFFRASYQPVLAPSYKRNKVNILQENS